MHAIPQKLQHLVDLASLSQEQGRCGTATEPLPERCDEWYKVGSANQATVQKVPCSGTTAVCILWVCRTGSCTQKLNICGELVFLNKIGYEAGVAVHMLTCLDSAHHHHNYNYNHNHNNHNNNNIPTTIFPAPMACYLRSSRRAAQCLVTQSSSSMHCSTEE